VPEDTPTVAIIGNLDLDGNVVPGSEVRVPRTGFSIPVFPPDELGPNVLDTNDWNYRFVSFEYENDEEMYITDPCLLVDSEPSPPSRDGTYDAGGRDLTIRGIIDAEATFCECFAPFTCAPVPSAGGEQSITLQGVLTIEVQYIDFTGGPGRTCFVGPADSNYGVPGLIIRVTRVFQPASTIVMNLGGSNLWVLYKSVEWSESRNVEITFADDPDNPVFIEDLPKLS
jgi:hypothetical protein